MKKFTVKILILTAICCAVNYGLQMLMPKWNLKPVYPAILYYLAITLLVFFISMMGVGKNNKLFIKAFMTGLSLHLMFSVGGLAAWLIFLRDSTVPLNIPFIVSYLLLNILFTGFEIMNLITTLRPFSKKN
ncbi:MAG: hypothetical protein SGJ10_01430 [Bacteroidota bacterium]|nr:hypothetical protein [Bacteroidota bacterium]